MNKMKTTIVIATLAVVGGAGMILGNHLLTSKVMAADAQTETAVIVPENNLAANTDAGIFAGINEGTVMLAAPEKAGEAQTESDFDMSRLEINPETGIEFMNGEKPSDSTGGNLSQEEVLQMAIQGIQQEYGLELTQSDLEESDIYLRVEESNEETGNRTWFVWLYPQAPQDGIKSYLAWVDDKEMKLNGTHANYDIFTSVEGTPLADEISADQAEEIAIAKLTEKYALTQELLERLKVTVKYYEATDEVGDREKHCYWVNLYPTDTKEFITIGSYWAYIDAKTGEALKLLDQSDGKD